METGCWRHLSFPLWPKFYMYQRLIHVHVYRAFTESQNMLNTIHPKGTSIALTAMRYWVHNYIHVYVRTLHNVYTCVQQVWGTAYSIWAEVINSLPCIKYASCNPLIIMYRNAQKPDYHCYSLFLPQNSSFQVDPSTTDMISPTETNVKSVSACDKLNLAQDA